MKITRHIFGVFSKGFRKLSQSPLSMFSTAFWYFWSWVVLITNVRYSVTCQISILKNIISELIHTCKRMKDALEGIVNTFFSLCSAHPVDAALLPNEWHSSGTLSIAILQCIIAANKLRIDLCLYKNTSGGNHHIGNKWMLIWWQGQSLQMPGQLFFFIYICCP